MITDYHSQLARDDNLTDDPFAEGASIAGTFSRLAKTLKVPLVLTGSLAVGWHSSRHGAPGEERLANDIDLVVNDTSDLPPHLCKDFLVSHFHPSRRGGRILLQLVDEIFRVRVDVFSSASSSLMIRTQPAELLGIVCRVVSPEDLTAKLLAILSSVTIGKHVDPKHYESLNVLLRFADFDATGELWADYRKPEYPQSFAEALSAVLRRIKEDPKALRQDVYCTDLNETCPWCKSNGLFRVSPRSKIFEVLGYV